MGRRGPGSGLRQARTAHEAAQWCRLFGALASPHAERVLPHLGLRSGDAAALGAVASRVHRSLRSIMAGTHGPAQLRRVNAALAEGYAELERQHGARLARGVFALSGDGFPTADAPALMAGWDRALRQMAGDPRGAGVPEAKRDIVVALIGHHLAAVEPLDTLAAAESANGAEPTTDLEWLVTLARWRRHATVFRALARVLTPAERQRLVVFTQPYPRNDSLPVNGRPDAAGRRDVMRVVGAGAPSWGAGKGV